MGRYIQQSDLQAQTSSEAFTRVFDKDSDGNATTIANFCNVCIANAESELDMALGAYVGGIYLNNAGAVVDPAITSMVVDIALWYGVKRNPSAQGEKDAPELRGYKYAIDRLRKLADDDHFRARTAAGFPTLPQPVVDNTVQSDGVTSNSPWNDAASHVSGSLW